MKIIKGHTQGYAYGRTFTSSPHGHKIGLLFLFIKNYITSLYLSLDIRSQFVFEVLPEEEVITVVCCLATDKHVLIIEDLVVREQLVVVLVSRRH